MCSLQSTHDYTSKPSAEYPMSRAAGIEAGKCFISTQQLAPPAPKSEPQQETKKASSSSIVPTNQGHTCEKATSSEHVWNQPGAAVVSTCWPECQCWLCAPAQFCAQQPDLHHLHPEATFVAFTSHLAITFCHSGLVKATASCSNSQSFSPHAANLPICRLPSIRSTTL